MRQSGSIRDAPVQLSRWRAQTFACSSFGTAAGVHSRRRTSPESRRRTPDAQASGGHCPRCKATGNVCRPAACDGDTGRAKFGRVRAERDSREIARIGKPWQSETRSIGQRCLGKRVRLVCGNANRRLLPGGTFPSWPFGLDTSARRLPLRRSTASRIGTPRARARRNKLAELHEEKPVKRVETLKTERQWAGKARCRRDEA